MEAESLAYLLIIGLIAGWLASLIIGGGGLLRSLALGVVGSFVGGSVFSVLHLHIGVGSALVERIIVATVGAVIVAVAARFLA